MEDSNILKLIQHHAYRYNIAIVLSVKLINKNELAILARNTSRYIEIFSNLIDEICKKFTIDSVVSSENGLIKYIILPDDLSLAEKIAYDIYRNIQLYIDDKTEETYLKCSVGSIYLVSNNQEDIAKMLTLIAYNIQHSKNQGYYFVYHDNPLDIDLLKHNNCKLNSLRKALFNKTIKFMYQPIIDTETGKIIYHECLLRIPDEDGNYISVGPIIPEAENSGLITIVDFTVLEMAVRELESNPNISLSVNISNIGVVNSQFLKKAEELLQDSAIANRLIIEITETTINQDFVNTKKFIDKLHILGCRFALDDFGSGFSSFKQILNLPVDIIKIDGSYIRDIITNEHSKVFVEALIKLAASLGIKTVAEFVENGEIARFLISIKIDSMQGNFFCPAVDVMVNYELEKTV